MSLLGFGAIATTPITWSSSGALVVIPLNPNYVTAFPPSIIYQGVPVRRRVAAADRRALIASARESRLRLVKGITNNVSQTLDLQPAIDSTVEQETVTFDFGLILAATATILAISSVSCTVFQSLSDTVTDPTPASRLIGAAQIVASPNSGLASQAVSQLVGTMIGGVTYRLQCVVTTSDGQTLSLWTHLACQTPN